MIEREKKKLTPYLLEINQCPSLRTDSPIDMVIKRGLVEDTIRILCLDMKRKQEAKAERRAKFQERLLKPQRLSIIEPPGFASMDAA